MNILVSGATGFIGRHLSKSLVDSNNVYALVRKKSDASVLDKRIHLVEIVDDVPSMIKKIKKMNITGIVHLAAKSLKDHDARKIDDLIQSNILFGTQLLEIAVNSNIKWFLNTGTFWQHYNNKKYSPVDLYAATKQAFEDIAKFYIETTDLTFVTLKLNDTFGPHDTRTKIFNLWNKIANTGEMLKMSPGDQLIDISYIDDVVDAYIHLIKLLEQNPEEINGETYALKAKKRLTLKQLADLYEKISGKKLNIIWGGLPYRKREVMIPWQDDKELPGFEPKVSLDEGIKKFVKETRNKVV